MSRASAVVFSFIVFALAATPVALAEPLCKETDVWASGAPAFFQPGARRHARAAWLATVRDDLGEAYATWDTAKHRRVTCTRPTHH